MTRTLILVGTGGFLGSVLRYLVQFFVEKEFVNSYTLGTFIVNIVGSFLVGVAFAFADKGNLMSNEWRIFLTIGFFGGFTTFSSFAYQNFNLIKNNSYEQLMLNVGGSLIFCILAVYLGMILVRLAF